MWPSYDSLALPTNVFTILRDLIHEKTGLDFDPDKRQLLAEKLSSRAQERGFNSLLDYYYLLKYGPGAEDEWPRVLDALSVQETYFCREMGQILAFTDKILPAYIASFPHCSVDVWCAACATGEEPLTIAMTLHDKGWFDRLPIRIWATDASQAALAKARRGIYRDRSFRAIPKALRDKYFTAVAEGWQIDLDVFRRVTYAYANLRNAAEIRMYSGAPFIFCRNVFIYFSDEAISETISEFARNMPRPGYLFVGASESLLTLTTDFELESVGDAFAYVLN